MPSRSRAWLARRLPGDNRDAGAGIRLLSQLQRVDRPPDGILRDNECYFVVDSDIDGDGDTPYKYPVLPSFDHWRFPHGAMPAPWSALVVPPPAFNAPSNLKERDVALVRDLSCRITGYMDATDAAHLVPAANGDWFTLNNMQR
jgi:hypothetical protein